MKWLQPLIRPWRPLVILVTVGVLAPFAVTPVFARPTTSSVRPTVVLVHGAWADASSWNRVIDRLDRDGYPVVAVADPLRSVAGDAAYVSSILATIEGPIVLVGHSYGGVVITNAAAGNNAVEALVYIDAFVPDIGESTSALLAMFPGSGIPAAVRPRPFPQPDGSAGVDLYLDADQFRDVFAGDVPRRAARTMAITQRPLALDAANGPTTATAWTTIPSWYLVGTEDRCIPPATQEFMAQRAGAHIEHVRSSHASPVSHPAAVERLIETAADATD